MVSISVVIPVYNVELYLKRCVFSVLDQTFKEFELILVDDGSTDNSGKICDDLKLYDKRIKVIHKQNGGLSSARNIGIKNATSDYITFIDSDDFIAKDYLNYAYDLLIKYNADIISVDYKRVSKIITEKEKKDNIKVMTEFDSVCHYLKCGCKRHNNYPAWNKIYKKELFSDIIFPEGKIYEDMYTNLKLFFRSKKTIFSTKLCYFYWINPNSITQSCFSDRNYDLLTSTKSIQKFIKKTNNELLIKYSNAIDAKALFSLLVKLLKDRKYIKSNFEKVKQINSEFKNKIRYLLIKEIPLTIKFISVIFYFFYDIFINLCWRFCK